MSKHSTGELDLENYAWQSALNRAEAVSVRKKVDGNEHRYCFVFNGAELLWVVAYDMNENGEWDRGEKLSASAYAYKAFNSTDPIEFRIGRELTSYLSNKDSYAGRRYKNAAEAIMPYLVGTDRVLDEDGNVMKVRESAPVIEFSVKEDYLWAESNVKTDPYNNNALGETSIECDGTTYWVTHPDETQKAVLRSLLQNKRYPLSAAKKLIETADKLVDIITIDVSALRKLEYLQPVFGTGRTIVKVTPDRSNKKCHIYDMEAFSEPLLGGHLRFKPGDGPLVYVDGDNLVSRDFQAENDSFDRLNSFVSGLSSVPSRVECPQALLELLEFIHDNPEDYVMEWPEGEEIKFGGSVSKSTWNTFVETGTHHDWFSIVGDFNFGGTPVPVQQLIKAAQNSGEGEFVQIGEKEYVRMSQALKKQLSQLGMIGEVDDEGFKVPKYFVGDLAEIVQDGDSSFKDLLDKVQQAYDTTFEVPAELNGTLRGYQQTGYQWLCRLSSWGAGACLADDMGLGKTIQTIAFLLHKAPEGPSLVIAPTTVVANWRNELGNFAPTLRPVIVNNVPDRSAAIAAAGPGDVFLASYGVLSSSCDDLKGRTWNVVCLDEAHQIKNRFTKVSESAMSLRAGTRLILTGTPLQNNVSELWNLMQFINPGLLGTYKSFTQKYAQIFSKDEDMQKLKSLTQPFILRRSKEDVVSELPVKTEFDYMVQLTEAEMNSYEQLRTGMELFYETLPPQEKMKFFFGDLGKLRRAACSLRIDTPDYPEEPSKIRELRYLLGAIAKGDNSIVIFSQYVEFLGDVRRMLTGLGIKYLYMDGQTPMNQREEIIKDFQDGKCQVFVCSLKAGGIGINLTRANYVILTDPWWNPAIEQQAMDRAYRIGQTRSVTFIRLISYHTVEERVTELQAAKRNMSDDLLKGTSQTASLTYEDIKKMLTSF